MVRRLCHENLGNLETACYQILHTRYHSETAGLTFPSAFQLAPYMT